MSLKILLDDQIQKLYQENPELKGVPNNQFEVAVACFANVKHINGIEIDDLIDGIMGDGGDEGIDHCYLFCNGVLVTDDTQNLNKDSHIKVKFFQTKKESGFSTDGFRKMKEGVEEIFNLEIDLIDLKKIGANPDFLEKTNLIRSIYRKAALAKAKFSCEMFYVTVASESKISEKIQHLVRDIKQNKLKIPFDIHFLNAQDLLDLTSSYEESIEINFISQPLEIKERDVQTSGYAGFVSGNDLVKCLIDEKKNFKSHLTEGNVRFFLGEDTQINSSIIETANSQTKSEAFWAMNNGLTIIGDSVSALGGNQYAVSNPQIVNGCQTIHCLYDAYSESQSLPKNLKVFVKIVETNDLEVQTDIISATNSQNPVKSASLKANDDIQRNIEKHLNKFGILYERRENYYKRQGHTGNKVVGLVKMAQIINTVANKEAVSSLNEAAKLFSSEGKYQTLFSNTADYDIYRFSVVLYQKAWSLKNSDLRVNSHDDETRSLISKGGLVFLHAMSSIILSDAKFGQTNTSAVCIEAFDISSPAKSSEFIKRKTSAFQLLDDDSYMKVCYENSRGIALAAINSFSIKLQRDKALAFKYRPFDREFLKPEISSFIASNTKPSAS